ncbi:hypothetical protein [Fusibacter tunisiensis]|uniref:Uncharacterized protein n=1 Tax=Fusibacter tunisiensis TaxID=1008308 RepID=A0ABS2MPH9_9FIRM|nr:hypothetical protein [Fusibacter tunisiensis]MBM7561313.1 hypothetical protein [Fusibacter tunisiensis]
MIGKMKFVRARATTTRLMGVVGLVATWQDLKGQEVVQVYHLDYESYGIDGFHHFINPDPDELSQVVLGVTGGLGGTFVEITESEFVFLIKSAYVVDEGCLDALVDFESFEEIFETLYVDLSESEEIALYRKLTPEMVNDEMCIHYFVMRYVGCDYPGAMLLWKDGAIDPVFELMHAPHTLIKNTCALIEVKSGKKLYRVEALVDFETKYKLIVISVEVCADTRQILSAELLETLTISSTEAAFNLSKPEYMMVMQAQDSFFERRFVRDNPELMKQTYIQGNLYIEFNPDNAHVAENPYYLNGDIYALYFFGYSGQVIVCTMTPETLGEIDQMLENRHAYEESLSFICELKTDDPVLYTYINSGYDNLFDFLK